MNHLAALLLTLVLTVPAGPQNADLQEAPAEEIWSSFNRLRSELRTAPVERLAVLDEWARLHSRARVLAAADGLSKLAYPGLEESAASAGLYFSATKVVSFDFPTLDLTRMRELWIEESSYGGRRLWPDFDAGGIAVAADERGLHATIALIRRLVPLRADDVRSLLVRRLDGGRKRAGFKSLSWKRRFDEIAQMIAEDRPAAKAAVEDLGDRRSVQSLRYTSTTPSGEGFTDPSFNDPSYKYGGIGVWFGRTREYPGGCYRFAVLLTGAQSGFSLRH